MKRNFILFTLTIIYMMFRFELALAANTLTIDYSVDHHEHAIQGGKFTIVKVADLIDGDYCYTDSWKGCSFAINDILTKPGQSALTLAACKPMPKGMEGTTDQYGKITFEKPGDGIWLLFQNGKESDAVKYQNASPALIQIPQWIGKEYKRDIIIYPKTGRLQVDSTEVKEEMKDATGNDSVEIHSTKSIKTGDSNTYIPYISLGILAIIVLAINLFLRGKNR